MSAARAKLKQIQKLLKDEDYESVVAHTKDLLKAEKGQGQIVYNALVFAGVALSKLAKVDEAEKVRSIGCWKGGADTRARCIFKRSSCSRICRWRIRASRSSTQRRSSGRSSGSC